MGHNISHDDISVCGKFTTVAVYNDTSKTFCVKPVFEDLAVLSKAAPVLVLKNHLRDASDKIIGWTVNNSRFVLSQQPTCKILLTNIARNRECEIEMRYIDSSGKYTPRRPGNVYRLAIAVADLEAILAGESPSLSEFDLAEITGTRCFCQFGTRISPPPPPAFLPTHDE
jgi:hypothetical protein